MRRRFSAEYRLKILRQADACRAPGELGALLRREGLYSSLPSTACSSRGLRIDWPRTRLVVHGQSPPPWPRWLWCQAFDGGG